MNFNCSFIELSCWFIMNINTKIGYWLMSKSTRIDVIVWRNTPYPTFQKNIIWWPWSWLLTAHQKIKSFRSMVKLHLITQISTMHHCNISCNSKKYHQKYEQISPTNDYRFLKFWNFDTYFWSIFRNNKNLF